MQINHYMGVFDVNKLFCALSDVGYLIADSAGRVTSLNDTASTWLGVGVGDVCGDVGASFAFGEYAILVHRFPIAPASSLYVLTMDQSETIAEIDDILDEYWAVLSESSDEIFVTDEKGVVLRVTSQYPGSLGYMPEELLGRNVYDMEKSGVMRPSTTARALAAGQNVEAFQTTGTGRKLFVRTYLLFDSNKKVKRVVSLSKDVTELSVLRERIREMDEQVGFYKELLSVYSGLSKHMHSLVGASEPMQDLQRLIHKAASVDSTILIQGESGTGKDLIAHNIHSLSKRGDKPFFRVNCGAIPETLLESELFGYGKGAFTGAASHGKRGLVDAAGGGTLFLDEIGDMSLLLQVKLLELVQDRVYKRVGENTYNFADIRIIAATNQNLSQMVMEKRFRKDLFYRLNVLPIHVAPLRERAGDLRLLLHHFTMLENSRAPRNVIFTEAAIQALEEYEWPGNVRELENVVERLFILADDDRIEARHVQDTLKNQDNFDFARNFYGAAVQVNEILPWKEAVDMLGARLFGLAFKKYRTITETAKHLGVHYSTVSRYLKRLREEGETKRSPARRGDAGEELQLGPR